MNVLAINKQSSFIANNSSNFTKKVNFKSNISNFNTMNTLYSDEYVPKRKFNDEGFPVTTIIDKKNNNKPIEAFIVCTKKEKDYESYSIFVEDDDDCIQVGQTSFTKGKVKDTISTGYMESFKKDRFAGCGIREHQLGLQRMKQLGLKHADLFSLSGAFPFHTKCGFVPITNTINPTVYNNDSIDDVINTYSKILDIPVEIVARNLSYRQAGNMIAVNEPETKAKMAIEYYDNNLKLPNKLNVYMELSDNAMPMWDKLIEKEAIVMP